MSRHPPEDWNNLSIPAESEITRFELSAPRRPRRWFLSTILVLSITVLIAGWLTQLNLLADGPSKKDLIQGRNAALLLADKAVRDYARHNGHYPAKLEDAIALPPELKIEYTQSKSDFKLRAKDDDVINSKH